MGFTPDLERLLALASAVPLLVVGVLLLPLRPRRPENLFFAAFATLWGGQLAASNLSRLTDDAGLSRTLYLVNFFLYLPTALCLAYFASIHPQRNALGRSPWGAAALSLFVLPGAAFLLFSPDDVFRTQVLAGRPANIAGPAAVPFFFAPFYGAFYYALVTQLRSARSETSDVGRARARMVFLALALYASWATTKFLLSFAFPARRERGFDPTILAENVLLFGAGAAVLGGLALFLVARPVRPGDRDLPMLAAILVPASVAVAEHLAQPLGVQLGTGWLWRILAVSLVVYAVARYQLFDIDVRFRRATLAAIPAALAAITAAALIAIAGRTQAWFVVAPAALIGLAANVTVFRFRQPLAARLLLVGGDDAEYLYHRKLEVYRARLEQVVAEDAEATPDEPTLRQLRRQLGISEREHYVLEFVVRQGLGPGGAPPAPSPRAGPGALLLGRYRVERLLGEGAHGRAYLAHDETTDRPVVVKVVGTAVLGGRAARYLMREARLAGALRHPNVVEVLDVHEGPDEAFIVMEYADGGTLFGLLQRRTRLGLAEAARILDEILAGLEAAHAKGIVHRDIKPDNILLTRDGAVKLADFGVAREERPDATAGLTQAGAMGTLLYMSPEQVRGVAVDARSDLYAAAVVFHQALTGRFYLRVAGRDDFQLRQLILRGAPRLGLDGQPAWVAPFVQKALAKDAAKRYSSGADMRKALKRFQPV